MFFTSSNCYPEERKLIRRIQSSTKGGISLQSHQFWEASKREQVHFCTTLIVNVPCEKGHYEKKCGGVRIGEEKLELIQSFYSVLLQFLSLLHLPAFNSLWQQASGKVRQGDLMLCLLPASISCSKTLLLCWD